MKKTYFEEKLKKFLTSGKIWPLKNFGQKHVYRDQCNWSNNVKFRSKLRGEISRIGKQREVKSYTIGHRARFLELIKKRKV